MCRVYFYMETLRQWVLVHGPSSRGSLEGLTTHPCLQSLVVPCAASIFEYLGEAKVTTPGPGSSHRGHSYTVESSESCAHLVPNSGKNMEKYGKPICNNLKNRAM